MADYYTRAAVQPYIPEDLLTLEMDICNNITFYYDDKRLVFEDKEPVLEKGYSAGDYLDYYNENTVYLGTDFL